MIQNSVYDPAHQGDVEGVRQWLEAHPDSLNTPVNDGLTLLHIACAFGHEPLVSFLLGRMALVNVPAMGVSEATPLHLAIEFRDEEIAARVADSLIANGAELNARQSDGTTAFHHAVARGSERLVKLLTEAGADPHLKDKQGRSVAQLAKESGLSLMTVGSES